MGAPGWVALAQALSGCPLPPPLWARHQAGTSGHQLIPSFPEAFEADFAVSQMGKLRLQAADCPSLSQEGPDQESALGCRRPEPSSGLRSCGQRCSAWAGPPLSTSEVPAGSPAPSGLRGLAAVLPGVTSFRGPRPWPSGHQGMSPPWPSAHPAEGDGCPLGSSHGPASQLGAAPDGRPSLGPTGSVSTSRRGHPPRRARTGRAGVPSLGACRAGLPGPRLQPDFTASSPPPPPSPHPCPPRRRTLLTHPRERTATPGPARPRGPSSGPAQAQGLVQYQGPKSKEVSPRGPSPADG